MFTRVKNYASDIVLGERYRDEQTGFTGIATSTTFFQHACERVAIESYDRERQRVNVEVFDAPRLTHVETGKTAQATKTGGPQMPNAQAGPMSR